MQFKHFLLLVCFFVLPFVSVSAQGFLKAEGKDIVDENSEPFLLRGMGLGGWMVQEGYMLQTASFAGPQHAIRAKVEELIGEADTELFYDAWLNNHVRKADIDALKSWGFNSVRLPMHYNLFTLPIEDEPVAGEQTWLDRGFVMTDSLISWCKQNEMYVILDLHAAPGGQGMDQAISDYDPSKPSLWESVDNQNKTIALWKRIAERYADEPWVAGYDLLNEVNWELPNNAALKSIYLKITEAIREVDTRHIIFIEGNWFANDFTGLTPPWEDNIVYSPHKYWSFNDVGSIQWVLNIREEHKVPLYLGESGENSNTWFRDAIHLLEENNIGWAWWPMKKVESIAGPLSVIKTDNYQTLLDYWNGTGPTPTAAFAKSALLELTENLKFENCIFQKDVIDAMFRQVVSDEVIPFKTQSIPGIVYATDFDMGRNGIAYFDADVANYNVSTGVFTAWNNGWAYRNDGVDIEVTEDNVNSNGYNVGWLNTGEWMQYDIDVTENKVYDIEVRVASTNDNGIFRFGVDGSDLTTLVSVPNTGGWQDWQTVTIPDVVLNTSDKKLLFKVEEGVFNLGSFNFKATGISQSVATKFLSASTLDEQTVELNINKRIIGPMSTGDAGFTISVNGSTVPITNVVLSPTNTRTILFTVNHTFKPVDEIRISYGGIPPVDAVDNISLESFNQRLVKNNIIVVHPVPGRIQAEDYFFQVGMQLENTSDAGGGQNIGFLDQGDYADYLIEVASTGIYEVTYRTAAESATGRIKLQIKEADNSFRTLQTVNFPPTGGWQEWANTSSTLSFPETGQFHIRLQIEGAQFNVNWFDFANLTATEDLSDGSLIKVYPNPSEGVFNVSGTFGEVIPLELEVYNALGQQVYAKSVQAGDLIEESLDLRALPNAYYYLAIKSNGRLLLTRKLLKW